MREAQNARNNRAEIVKALSTGEALFLKACAACHTVGEGDKVGPDLAGVAQRRPRDWLIRFMMEPDVMIAGGDPVAVALDRRYKGVTMPNLTFRRPTPPISSPISPTAKSCLLRNKRRPDKPTLMPRTSAITSTPTARFTSMPPRRAGDRAVSQEARRPAMARTRTAAPPRKRQPHAPEGSP